MISNRGRLRRTRDGRYEVGVYIERDKYARFVAKVLVAYDREGVSQVACRRRRNFDQAAKAGHSWALEHRVGLDFKIVERHFLYTKRINTYRSFFTKKIIRNAYYDLIVN